MCPRLGIEPATLWFPGRHSVHWATPARVASAPEQIHSSLRRRKRAVLLGTIASLSVCHKLLYSGGFQTYLALSHRKKYILHTLLTCIQQKEKFRKQHLDLQHTIHSDIFCSFYFISLKKKKCGHNPLNAFHDSLVGRYHRCEKYCSPRACWQTEGRGRPDASKRRELGKNCLKSQPGTFPEEPLLTLPFFYRLY